MSFEIYVDVLQTLLAKSKQGRQEWSEGPVDNSFYTHVGENGISIRQGRDGYSLLFHDKEGDIVDSVTDRNLAQKGLPRPTELLQDLYEMAKRNSLGADKVLLEIAKDLKSR